MQVFFHTDTEWSAAQYARVPACCRPHPDIRPDEHPEISRTGPSSPWELTGGRRGRGCYRLVLARIADWGPFFAALGGRRPPIDGAPARWPKRGRSTHLDLALLTFGLLFATAGAVRMAVRIRVPVDTDTGGALRAHVNLLGTSYPMYRLFIIGVGLAVAVGLTFVFDRTLLGATLRAGRRQSRDGGRRSA